MAKKDIDTHFSHSDIIIFVLADTIMPSDVFKKYI